MRYAFVDDATLDAAKRMEGKATAKSTLETFGDILALENLIQAILFYDQILYLDRSGNRKNSQNNGVFEGFQRVSVDPETYKMLLRITNAISDDLIPCIEGGKFTDDCFCAFFRALNMNLRFIWEKRADTFCLTPRIIDKEENQGSLYDKLLYMMLYELSDTNFQKDIGIRIPLLYDSQGQIINNCYLVKDKNGKKHSTKLSRQTEALFKAINRMSFRSVFYTLIAKELKADLILSPLRSLFQWECLNLKHGSSPAGFLQEMPLFSLYIVNHMEEDTGFIQAAFKLREEEEFVKARNCLNEMEQLMTEDRINEQAIRQMSSELDKEMGAVAKKYRISPKKKTSADFAMIGNLSGIHDKLPSLENFHFRINSIGMDKAEPHTLKRNRFGLIFRSIRKDLDHIDELGDYFDVITSRIKYRTGSVLQNIRVEMDGRFDEKRWWKAPM